MRMYFRDRRPSAGFLSAARVELTVILAGLCLFSPHFAAADGLQLPIDYSLTKDAQISLLVNDGHGKVVRELLHAAPRKAGPNRENWDGLDEAGRPVPAGNYHWKLLSTQGLSAEYLMSLGTNLKVPWDTWPGNHNGVWAVASDETGLYFGGTGEGTPPLVKQSFAEARLWSVPQWLDAWQGGADLAVAGGKVFMLNGRGKLWLVDAASGKPESAFDLLWDPKDGDHTPDLGCTQILDMDARGTQMVASYANHDAVRWLGPKDGKVLDEASVPSPLGVALTPDGDALAISEGQVVALGRDHKTPRVLIGKGALTSPWRLAVDQKNGDIFVAERGAGQQVKKFTSKGELIEAFGVLGGRAHGGLYDPNGFWDPSCITADDAGGFYICEWEHAPRRTAHFDTAGKLLREWYGGQMYANFAAADPGDPSLVWLDSHWGSLIQAKVDYLHKSWTVRATYEFAGLGGGLVASTSHGGGRWLVRRHGDAIYLCRQGEPCILRVDEAGRQLLPLVASRQQIIIPWGKDKWNGLPQWFQAQLGNDTATAMHSYFWMDTNGDGIPQKDEMNYLPWSGWLQGWNPGEDFSYLASGSDGKGGTHTYRFAVDHWTPHGLPIYKPLDQAVLISSAQTGNPWCAPDGSIFGAANQDNLPRFGQGFWSARTGGNRVTKLDKSGQILWQVGRHAPGVTARPGEAKFFWRVVGVAHGCVAVGDVEDYATHVWDQDGLWVGRLLDHPDLTVAPPAAYSSPIENFGGSLYENPKTGNVIFFASGINNCPVYRIRGFDQFQRQSGNIMLSPTDAASLTAQIRTEARRPDIAHVLPAPDKLAVDGDLSEWKDRQPLEIKDGDQVRARVWLTWNAAGLYAAFDVNTDRPWKSAASTQLAFQGGASVTLNVGRLVPGQPGLAAGDVRLVAAPLQGSNRLVQFMPLAAPGLAVSGRQPVYETGNGKVTFQRVEVINQGVAMRPHADPDNPGYSVEMFVPSAWSGLNLRPGDHLKLDASIALSNPEGNHTQTRLNWHTTDARDMATQDVFTEAQLRPEKWAEAGVE